jgi:hypothetical protein
MPALQVQSPKFKPQSQPKKKKKKDGDIDFNTTGKKCHSHTVNKTCEMEDIG